MPLPNARYQLLFLLVATVLLATTLSLPGVAGEDTALAGSPMAGAAADSGSPQVLVTGGTDELIEMLKAEDWWGEEKRGEQMMVPHLILTGINPNWNTNAQSLTVQDKKELFYRLMLPLVLHANGMVTDYRAGLQQARAELKADGKVSPGSLELLQRLVILLPGSEEQYADALSVDNPELAEMIDDLLYRVDTVPAGLALGQAAYESGYGTSRFAREGNSLFGQWTYRGDGIVPGKQRKHLGNHQIKAFDWPFDSVRGYFINLMTHPAYEDFRRIRARLREQGKPLDSLVLADGLMRYSERGQEYVRSLKGMIRHNGLERADNAAFRDEPVRFIISEDSPEDADKLRGEIEEMRNNGEVELIVERMRLD